MYFMLENDQVMYGGRVTDCYDRRISFTYIDEYFGDFLFDEYQPFHFYKSDVVDYVLPPEGEYEDYLNFIEELPLVQTPEIFGLHPNAEIEYFTHAVKEIWMHLIELQPQIGTSILSHLRPIPLINCHIILPYYNYKSSYALRAFEMEAERKKEDKTSEMKIA
jgi:hypothetical protein